MNSLAQILTVVLGGSLASLALGKLIKMIVSNQEAFTKLERVPVRVRSDDIQSRSRRPHEAEDR